MNESELQLISALDQVPDGICITDLQGTITYVNSGFVALTGFSRDELLGGTPRLVKSGVHDEAFYRGVWETLLGGEAFLGDFTNRRKDGALYEVESNISPARGDEGAITHFVCVQREVTGRRQAQRLEALGELVAGVAHEVNNPTSFLSLNLAVVEEFWRDALPMLDAHLAQDPSREVARMPWSVCREELPKLLAGLRAGTERITAIVRGLKEFARPVDATLVEFDVRPVIEAALTLTGSQLRRGQPNVVVQVDDDLPRVLGIPARLEQVIVNLLVNASHFAPDDGGEISVRARLGRGVEIAIGDNGPGVPEQIRARIFDPFFTTRGGKGGTGLGLSVSSRIVQGMGGTLSCEPLQPRGVCFRVSLPAV